MVFAAPGGAGTGLVLDILMVMAGLTMVLAILGAMGTHEIRRLLALVLASHVGFLVFGIALMTPESHAAVLFYMTQEMLVVAALFLAAGVISEVAGSDDLHEIGGLYRRSPWLAVAFLIAALSLFGAPPLSGFHGKVLLIREGFLAGQPLLTAALLVTALLTLAAVLKVWAFGFWSPLKGERLELPPGATFGPRRPMRPAMAGVWVLVIASLLFGIGAEPMIGYAMDATNGLLEPRGYVEAVLGPGAWPAEPASGLAEAAAIPAAEVIP
jgi:multicomponent Na+:H+ antiporter subunit D